jgi:hypothetical protein
VSRGTARAKIVQRPFTLSRRRIKVLKRVLNTS